MSKHISLNRISLWAIFALFTLIGPGVYAQPGGGAPWRLLPDVDRLPGAVRFRHSLTYRDQFRPTRDSRPGCRKPSRIQRLDFETLVVYVMLVPSGVRLKRMPGR